MRKTISFLLGFVLIVQALVSCGSHIHSFGDWDIIQNATCSREGIRRKYCSCGEMKEETLPKLDHKFENGYCTWCNLEEPTRPQPDVQTKIETELQTQAPEQPTEPTLVSISIQSLPNRVLYSLEDELNTDGLSLEAKYSNGLSQAITSGFSCSPLSWDTTGSQQIAVTYQGNTCTFNITVFDEKSFSTAKVGDTVLLGKYEQDNIPNSNPESIEWQVLKKEGTKLLLISKYSLDSVLFNSAEGGTTWETCSLRTWLNNDFWRNAFSDKEKKAIQTTRVEPDINPDYPEVSAGNATNDWIFILSLSEAKQYFPAKESRKCVPTAYAISRGSFHNPKQQVNNQNAGCWWLRTPNKAQNILTDINSDGSFSSYEANHDKDRDSVRPVLWLDYSKLNEDIVIPIITTVRAEETTKTPKEPANDQISDREIVDFFEDVCASQFNKNEYNVSIENNVLFFIFSPENFHLLVYRAMVEKSYSAIVEWNSVVQTGIEWCKSFLDIVRNSLDRKDLSVGLLYVLEDSPDSVSIGILNGVLYLDCVNGIYP